ncbi:acylphosphatase, partial [Maribacter sp. UBA4516]
MHQKTYHIQIKGRVQGVGFRPFVFNLAKQFTLDGYVTNNENGVEICVTTSQE